MKRNQIFGGIFLFLICANVFSIITLQDSDDIILRNTESEIQYPRFEDNIKSSANQMPLNYSDFYLNASIIRRTFEPIKFMINVSAYNVSNDANYTLVQISFTNNTVRNYTMSNIGNGNYTYTYTPENDAPLGFQNVSFLIYEKNATNHLEQLNNQTTFTNFTIISNSMVSLNSSVYNRGEFLNAEIMVKEDITTWSLYITDDKNQQETKVEMIGTDIHQFSREIDSWFETSNTYYYVRVNLTYNGKDTAEYFRFKVLNSDPIIDIASVIIDPSPVFRNELFRIDFNVSDYEDPNTSFFNVSLAFEDPDGNIEVSYNKDQIDYLPDGEIRKRYIEIPASSPVGTYRAIITVLDSNGGSDTYTKTFTVKNNPPKIHDYKINGFSLNESISVFYGEDLEFTFNVSDVEDEIAFITVALLNQENEWFNITRAYTGENMTITIRTIELIKGKWYVYIFVIDEDGAITGLDTDYSIGPKEIDIIPDTLGVILPWIAFFIGIGLGILFGISIGITRSKRKSTSSPSSISSKKGEGILKKQRKGTVKKSGPKKIRCVKCGALIDEGAKRCPNCGDKVEQLRCEKCGAIIDLDTTKCPNCGDKIKSMVKETPPKQMPQRKIKRKLK